ncbi:hypothetical protein [Acidisoma silvae]|uniref:Uncharacterized protein n=1 Tax=Acidisoma silvae TaxID=2802396 RepID=A0A964DY15_9PROT|nr:hypothetical protein [Acidisoma silvae]MCB8874454.1 hypothetical protein [Acidisoma silvae]
MVEPIASEAERHEDAMERQALAVAVAKARANVHGVSHDAMRLWLMEIADGNFQAEPPQSKL